METVEGFNPKRYLTKVGGNDYLPVAWRVYWLRSQHPDAIITTELIKHVFAAPDDSAPAEAIFRAHVIIPDGGEATGWGSEDEADFHDYIEKAETKALGRALAALGFGVQFAGDEFEEVAPQDRKSSGNSNRSSGKATGKPEKLATAKQFADMGSWREARGLTEEEMQTIVRNVTGKESDEALTDQEAGRVLYLLNRKALDELLAGPVI